MVPLRLPDRALRLLCLGAHADDIEIGCAGTLLTLLEQHPGTTVRWEVFSATLERCHEARASAELLLGNAARAEVFVHGVRDGHFPTARAELKERFEQLKQELAEPDLVFTHFLHDRHQDHRTVAELTWETFRHHCILEYEVPKYDGDLGSPNVFVSLSEGIRERKLTHLLAAFPSQRDKRAFGAPVFEALLRVRGLEGASPNGCAEAFYARKLLLQRN